MLRSLVGSEMCIRDRLRASRGQVGVLSAVSTHDLEIATMPFTLPNTLAAGLQVDGPRQNFETACSSGYMAMQRAVELIEQGECSTAVVGGAWLMLKTDYSLSTLAQHILSPSGRMRPLDATADGMVCGEACAAVVLEEDGLARVGGRSKMRVTGHGYTRNSSLSPAGFADSSLMRQAAEQALERAGLVSSDISFLHLHAMGNPGSDVAELGVAQLLSAGRAEDSPLVLSSHKANLGHSVSASGIMALIVTALGLEHRMVQPAINLTRLGRKLVKMKNVLVPMDSPVPLTSGGQLSASISGTSASGDNLHFVITHEFEDPNSGKPIVTSQAHARSTSRSVS
eukprot:TRINITY_DN36490_c0_g1_i1.p1 TRINITY_DN36490_c0_g1~~TRINITY_DN36490_c0_g1_i1.p1  ORF type:complete len:341 (-),score=60.10 TRINITY_DN36490_c0_g1_i1:58-1080(-)